MMLAQPPANPANAVQRKVVIFRHKDKLICWSMPIKIELHQIAVLESSAGKNLRPVVAVPGLRLVVYGLLVVLDLRDVF